MSELRRRRRQQATGETIGEAMGMKPLEPMVLKFFWPRELLEKAFCGDDEAVGALRAVMQAATSTGLQCLICKTKMEFPGMTIVGRSASNRPVGFVSVLCQSCADSEDIRDDVIEAMGETEIKTSTRPS